MPLSPDSRYLCLEVNMRLSMSVRRVCALVALLLLADQAACDYVPLTFQVVFETTSAFCVFVENQYTRSRYPIGVLATNTSLPACFDGVVQGWIPVTPTTTPYPTSSTSAAPTPAPTTTTSTTESPTSTAATNATESTVEPPTTADPSTSTQSTNGTTAPSTSTPTPTTVGPTASTTAAAVARRGLHYLDATNITSTNDSTTTLTTGPSTATATATSTSTSMAPTSSPSTSTNASQNSSTTPITTTTAPITTAAPTTAAPTPSIPVEVAFVMANTAAVDTIARENWVLSLSSTTLSALFDVVSLKFSQTPAPVAPSHIAINDPRANTTMLPTAEEVIFLLRLTSYYRYRLPTGQFLPWRLNDPSAGTIWANLGIILLGLNISNTNIDLAASWFPITWTSPQGSVSNVFAFNEEEMFSAGMFPCTNAYLDTPDAEDKGDGFNCWFRLASDATGLSMTTAQVMALLNSQSIRVEIAAAIGGGVSLDMVPISQFPRRTQSFEDISTAAQDDYSQKKGYFAAGLVVWFVVTVVALVALWVWTGSGRNMG